MLTFGICCLILVDGKILMQDRVVQTVDEEAVLEHQAALASQSSTLMNVPHELVPIVRELIARLRLDKDAAR